MYSPMKNGLCLLSMGEYTILFKFKGVSVRASPLNLFPPEEAPVQIFCSKIISKVNMAQQPRCSRGRKAALRNALRRFAVILSL